MSKREAGMCSENKRKSIGMFPDNMLRQNSLVSTLEVLAWKSSFVDLISYLWIQAVVVEGKKNKTGKYVAFDIQLNPVNRRNNWTNCSNSNVAKKEKFWEQCRLNVRFTSIWQCKTTEHTAQWQRCSRGHSCCIWLKNSFACACLQERPCIWARLVCERPRGRGLTLVSFRALYSRAVHTHQHTEIYTKTNNHMSNVHRKPMWKQNLPSTVLQHRSWAGYLNRTLDR